MIELVLPVYKLLKQQAISFDDYLDKISLLMKTEEEKYKEASIAERIEPRSIIMEEELEPYFTMLVWSFQIMMTMPKKTNSLGNLTINASCRKLDVLGTSMT